MHSLLTVSYLTVDWFWYVYRYSTRKSKINEWTKRVHCQGINPRILGGKRTLRWPTLTSEVGPPPARKIILCIVQYFLQQACDRQGSQHAIPKWRALLVPNAFHHPGLLVEQLGR